VIQQREEIEGVRVGPARVPLDAVVTHHMDGFRSGVARFNELLARHLGLPLVGLLDRGLYDCSCPLLSFKFSELGDAENEQLRLLLATGGGSAELFLHELSGLDLERELIQAAQRVHCGNLEIYEQVEGLNPNVDVLWTPGLLLDDRPYEPAEVSVCSFGMAHKLRIDMFRRLRELLEASRRSYVLYVSTANHETASMRDAEIVYADMHEIFPTRLYFMGNLSDVAVFNLLRQTTFFAAFFESGLRANNTSVAAAMEHGAIVITNLDRYSPEELRHMDNVIDITQCGEIPSDPLVLKRLSVRAMETGRQRGWDQLVARLTGPDAAEPAV
jgi:hypothetical protein